MSTITTFFAFIGLCAVTSLLGASLTLGVAVVCRALKWAPFNITVNIGKSSE